MRFSYNGYVYWFSPGESKYYKEKDCRIEEVTKEEFYKADTDSRM